VLTNVTLLTRRQVAETLAISLRTVDELIRTGDLPVVRLGGKSVRFRPAALQLFVEASESRRNPRTAARKAKKPARRQSNIEAVAGAKQ
jgi:excisionase family DNA binding protein